MLLHGETYLERLWRPGNVFRGLPESKAGFDFTLGYDHLVDYNHNYHQNYHHNHIPSKVMIIMIKRTLARAMIKMVNVITMIILIPDLDDDDDEDLGPGLSGGFSLSSQAPL